MRAMTILERCRAGQRDIEALKQRIERRRDVAMRITPNPEPSIGHGSANDDKLLSMASDVDELQRRIIERQSRLNAELLAACVIVDQLPENEARVIYGYYVAGDTVDGIAERIHYTGRYVRTLRKSGEKLLEDVDADGLLPGWYEREE